MIANILMGDVTGSRGHDAQMLKRVLASMTTDFNAAFKPALLSPLTVTLGDEFQGVLASFEDLVRALAWLEIRRLEEEWRFRLHFSAVRGEIDTEINPDIAHGMLGRGLTRAREMLTRKARGRPNYQFETTPPFAGEVLGDIFEAIDFIVARWSRKDFKLIAALISNPSDAEVGEMVSKTRQQIYKRRRTLGIDAYNHLYAAALRVAGELDGTV